MALSDIGNKKDAIACYDKTISLIPNYINAYNNKGIALSDLGNKNEAIECDYKAITQEMTQLLSEHKITKERLADLEEDVSNLIEHQDKTDERLQKLEIVHQTVEEMKAKIASDSKTSEKDKQIIESRIHAITNKVQNLAKQEDIEATTKDMVKPMSENKVTKGRLEIFEDGVDSLIEKTVSLTVNIISSIEYDNPLLNHPTLFKAVEQHYGLNKTFDLSQSLSSGLIDEAIHTNDSELLLAGIMSLHFSADKDINHC